MLPPMALTQALSPPHPRPRHPPALQRLRTQLLLRLQGLRRMLAGHSAGPRRRPPPPAALQRRVGPAQAQEPPLLPLRRAQPPRGTRWPQRHPLRPWWPSTAANHCPPPPRASLPAAARKPELPPLPPPCPLQRGHWPPRQSPRARRAACLRPHPHQCRLRRRQSPRLELTWACARTCRASRARVPAVAPLPRAWPAARGGARPAAASPRTGASSPPPPLAAPRQGPARPW
mmetsp:Transcript_11026/g.32753  ORF Transcript_11026/g.32753 Transcript_11026/m.32753 type:complete len:231 (-) Transcript_11026:1018-1710(-)